MDDERQYRILHRKVGETEWKLWSTNAYERDKAKAIITTLRENNGFFRWHREYDLQYRYPGEWEGP